MKRANIRKWAKLAVILAVFATLLLLPKPSQLQVAYGQGYGYGYDEGEPPPPTTGGGVGGITTSGGVFTETTIFKSADKDLTLVIPKNTVGKTKDDKPLPEVRITKVNAPPSPPQDKGFIGLSYDLEPDGATFEPPITITFTYNPNWIPAGLGPENLTVGYFDTDTQQWVMLDASDITIDPKTNTISASISHFTYYSVMAHTAPAEFTISDLTVSPSEIEIAEQSTISAVVTNTGDVSGKTKVTLKVNGATVASKIIEVAGHDSKTVSFITVQGEAGSYKIDLDGLTGTFTVKPSPVGPVVVPTTVPSISAPSVEYPAPTAPAPPTVPAPVPVPTPWLAIIVSLIVTAIVAGIVVWYFSFRTQY